MEMMKSLVLMIFNPIDINFENKMDVLDRAGDILTTIDEKLIALMKEQKYSRISPYNLQFI
jgi:hypothetical protein